MQGNCCVQRDAATPGGTSENLYKRRELKRAEGWISCSTQKNFRKIPAFKASWSPVTKHEPVSRSQQLPLQALRLLQMQSKHKTLTTQVFPQAFNQPPPFLQVSTPLLCRGVASSLLRWTFMAECTQIYPRTGQLPAHRQGRDTKIKMFLQVDSTLTPQQSY